jgi:Leucine-rich repeat (LRR) protein
MAASSTWFEPAYTWRYLLVVLVLVHGVVLQQPQQLVVFGQQQQLPWNQVQALLQLQKLLEYPSAMPNWSYNSNFCSLAPTPSLNITCSASSSSSAGTRTLTYLRVVGDKILVPTVDRLHITTTLEAAAAEAQGTAAPQQQNINYNSSISLSSSFNFSALVQTLFSFPELQGIELVSVGLWGNLPNFFSNQLPNLQVLNASSNLISGSPLPPSLSPPGLQALRVLALDRNAFTGGFPASSQLRSLQVLSLSDNQLSGELTNNDITSLQSLVSLSLAHNQFTGLLPSFESLVNLQSLNVGGNSFGPSFPASLGTMLVSLYLGENQLAGAIPSSLKNLTKLQTLDVSGNALSGNPPAFLFQLPSIVSLNLARNHLSGNLPYNLSLAPSLVFLDLSSNLLSGALPQAFLLSSSTANNQAPHAVTIKYQNNCLNTTKQQQETAQYCSSQTAEFAGGPIVHHHSSHQHMAFIAAIVGGSVVIGMAMCLLAMLLFKRWRSCDDDCSVVPPDHYEGNSSFANSIGIPSELLFNASM